MSKRVIGPCLAAALIALAGCKSAGNYLHGTPPKVLAAAGADGYNETGTVELFVGDAIGDDSVYDRMIIADDVWGLKFSYLRYDIALNGAGWPDLDAYKAKSGYYGGSIGFGELEYGISEIDLFRVGGVYSTAIAPGTLIAVEIADLSADLASGEQTTLYTSLGVKYYVNDCFRTSLDWRYSHDDLDTGPNESRNFYRLGAEYLVEGKTPLIPYFTYERIAFNNSEGTADTFAFGTTVYAGNQLRLSFGVELYRSDDAGDADFFKFGLGFQTPQGIASLDFTMADPDGGDTESGVTLGWKALF